jgi:plasmid stabilization system protein ParE
MSQEDKIYIVKWDDEAKFQLRSIYDHIKIKSKSNAKQVRTRILMTARSLGTMPDRYALYPPMINIPGNFRYKKVSSHLIIYDVTDNEVQIVKLVHLRKAY